MQPGILLGSGLEKTTLSRPPARTDRGRTRQSVVVHGNDAMDDRLWPWQYSGLDGYRDGHPLASYVDPTSLSVRRSCKRSGSILREIHAKFGCGRVTTWPRRSSFWHKPYHDLQPDRQRAILDPTFVPPLLPCAAKDSEQRCAERTRCILVMVAPRLTHALKGVAPPMATTTGR